MKIVQRKKIALVILLAMCMIFTLLPAAAFAESEDGAAVAACDVSGGTMIAGDASGGVTGKVAAAVSNGTVGKADTVIATEENGNSDDTANNKASNQAGESAVRGVTDIPGGSGVRVDTTVRDNYTDCDVTDAINITEGKDYIIDFTKGDNLSLALRSMADLDKTKYYKFANSDNNSLIETENPDEALLKIVGHKDENKAVMTLVQSINQDMSFDLKFMRTEYTGAKLTYTGTTYDENGKAIINEIRDDYYTRYNFNCKLNLIAAAEVVPDPGNTDQVKSDVNKDNNVAGQSAAKTQRSDSAARTGDEASPLLWAGILLLAAAGGTTAVLYRRKTKN